MPATIFPNTPIGAVPTTVIKTFNFLKTLPDGIHVWHYLGVRADDMPDFLVLNPDKHVILIKVSSATPKQFKSRLQIMLMGVKNEDIGIKETATLQNFQQKFEQSFQIMGCVDYA